MSDGSPSCIETHPGRACWRTAPGGYCLPPRCYCGSCPWWRDRIDVPTYMPDTYTSFDRAAIESGRRRSGSRVGPQRRAGRLPAAGTTTNHPQER